MKLPHKTIHETDETNNTDNSVYKTIIKLENGDIAPPRNNFQPCKLHGHHLNLANMFTEIDRNIINKLSPYVFFSFYRINVHENRYLLVTKVGQVSNFAQILKKIGTRHKKKTTKKYLLFVTCSGDKGKETKNTKKEEQQKKPGNEKNVINKKQKNDNVPGKKLKSMKPQKVDEFQVSNKKSNLRIERFHAKCSKYWKNISDVLSCTEMTDMKKTLPATEEKKHKRKKKHKKCKENPKKQRKKNNDDNTRQFRISTYLADLDWKKKKVDNKAEIGSSLRLNTQEFFDENEIEVNHVSLL